MEKDEMIAWAMEDAKDRGLGKIECVIIDVVAPPYGCIEVDSYWMDGRDETEHLVTLYRLLTEEETIKNRVTF